MKCPNCGARLKAGEEFCENCGCVSQLYIESSRSGSVFCPDCHSPAGAEYTGYEPMPEQNFSTSEAAGSEASEADGLCRDCGKYTPAHQPQPYLPLDSSESPAENAPALESDASPADSLYETAGRMVHLGLSVNIVILVSLVVFTPLCLILLILRFPIRRRIRQALTDLELWNVPVRLWGYHAQKLAGSFRSYQRLNRIINSLLVFAVFWLLYFAARNFLPYLGYFFF